MGGVSIALIHEISGGWKRKCSDILNLIAVTVVKKISLIHLILFLIFSRMVT